MIQDRINQASGRLKSAKVGVTIQAKGDRLYLERFKAHHRSSVSEVTWDKEYQEVFDCLPQNRPLTVDILQDAIRQTTENSRTRKRFCTSLGVLAKFADLDYNFKPLQGIYSSKRVDPRTLPHDQAIAECFYRIKNPAWQWVYGMIATYGREIMRCFFSTLMTW